MVYYFQFEMTKESTMIKSFVEYEELLSEVDFDFEAMSLSEQEEENLKSVIQNWTTDELKNGVDVIEDYFGLIVPERIIRSVLSNDIEMAYEVYSDGVRDTCRRDLFMDMVLKHIGVRNWPTYGESEEVYQQFKKELEQKAKENGIKFVED